MKEESRLIFGKGFNKENNYFKKAGDLPNTESKTFNNRDEINEYLGKISSHKKIGFKKELPYSGGTMIKSLEEILDMYLNGDNIIEAECLDEEGKMISVSYESYRDLNNIENKKRGR